MDERAKFIKDVVLSIPVGGRWYDAARKTKAYLWKTVDLCAVEAHNQLK